MELAMTGEERVDPILSTQLMEDPGEEMNSININKVPMMVLFNKSQDMETYKVDIMWSGNPNGDGFQLLQAAKTHGPSPMARAMWKQRYEGEQAMQDYLADAAKQWTPMMATDIGGFRRHCPVLSTLLQTQPTLIRH